jgi:hypothetical protein
MRYENPVVAIQQCKVADGKKAYTKTVVSFQLMGGTNIIGVNNLRSVRLLVCWPEGEWMEERWFKARLWYRTK